MIFAQRLKQRDMMDLKYGYLVMKKAGQNYWFLQKNIICLLDYYVEEAI